MRRTDQGAGAESPAAPEAFGGLPTVEDIELAPTGDRVAVVGVDGDQRLLIIQGLDGRLISRVPAGQAKVRDLSWAGSDHVLITTSTTAAVPRFYGRHEWTQVISYNVKTGKFVLLLRNTPGTLNAVLGEPVVAQHRGETQVFVRGVTLEAGGGFDLYRVDLDTGRGRIHSRGTSDTQDWIVDAEGSAVARSEYNGERGIWRMLIRAGPSWREVMPVRAPVDAPSLLGLGRTSDALAVMRRDDDKTRLYEIALAGGAVSAPLDDPARSIAGVLHDPATGRLLGLSYLDQRREYVFFDPALRRSWIKASKAFPNDHVSLQSWTPDFGKLVIYVEGPENAGAYYLVDIVGNKGGPSGRRAPPGTARRDRAGPQPRL